MTPTPSARTVQRRALIGSVTGSTIEWYDFLLYGTVVPLVFAPQFFPESDPFVAMMLAYFGHALTFLIRPFGGIIFASIGDRIGRKKTLVVTLSMMGAGTMAIGLLPTYAQIGVAAPLLLFACRIVQGLAIGGEWGGALLLAYEYAPNNKRGLFGAIPQTGVTWGLILGNIALLIAMIPGEAAFTSWIWRLPFLASFILIFLGLWIRKELDETPDFQRVKDAGAIERNPLLATLREYWREVLIAIAVKAVETAPFYIFATFMVTYATESQGYDKSTVLLAIMVGAVVASVAIPACGALSDRFGRARVYVGGVIALALVSLPYFLLADLRNALALIVASLVAIGIAWSFVTATLGTMMGEFFDAKIRYTGITLGYQIGAAIFSGTAPMLAMWMVHEAGGHWWPIPIYIAALAVLSLVGVGAARSRARAATR
ncbi:MHS family MFS transporter [Nanchangia anserum]|uniref:MHS family MFS transporter n=1 Tax=Nanchangia anserum TaxID=2692125 RepID=A0A8I0KRA2_9ACTO|nr:MFS transporter [Nanchangia anserum]MBD3689227.1 MHS family MFS transporter [Nanchangia anserum]QOX81450.1 MHS family MFS transporter [Nanchangia anserum]